MRQQLDEITEPLAVSEQRYRRLFESARDGILILDSDQGKIIDANPFMSDLLGYSREELLGKELWEIGLLEDQTASRNAFERLKEHGYIRYEDLPLNDRASRRHDVEFVSNLYPEGNRTVIQCNIRDITDRKLLEVNRAAAQDRDRRIAGTLLRTALFQPVENAFSGLSVQTVYTVASDEALAGGDYWDMFAFDDGHVALVCGDVLGHGLSSAAFTMELKFVLRAYIREHEQPSRILKQMQQYVSQSNRLYLEGINTEGSDTPVCLALAIIHRESGVGSLAVAAMEKPLLVRADGRTETMIASGTPLGVGLGPEPEFNQIDFQLAKDDTLIMFTDGITEAHHGNEFFGEDGLERLAKQMHTATLRQMGDSILAAVIEYSTGSLRDDACLVMVRKT
jgi:PAS domain S-box-containing protein